MPGTILLDDLHDSITQQLGDYASQLGSAAQSATQAIQPVPLIPTPQIQAPQGPDPNAILAELQQHAQDVQAQAQQAAQPALQVLGQGAQAVGGAVTQLGGQAQQAQQQLADQLVQHAQDANDTRQQLQDHVATVLGSTDTAQPAGVQSLAVPKPAPVLGGTQQDQNTPTLGATTGAVGGDVSGLPSADTTVAPTRVGQGQSAFIQSLQPLAAKVAARTGIDPNVMIAIAANETGWGQSSNAKDMNNLFSLQGDGSNGSRWASYTSPEQSFQAFSDLIQNAPRYAQAWADRADPAKFVGDLRNAGYVVDEPGYPAQGWVDQVNSINTNLPPVTGTTGTSTTQGVNQPIPQTASDWLDLAKQQLGKPYIWGSAGGRSDFSPTAAGFDCSGFVSYVYKDALGINLPAQTESAYAATKPIGGDQALPGDVVLYNMDNPDPHIQHIAIYIGSGQVIQAGGGVDKNVNIAPIGQAGNYEFRRAAGAETAIGNAAATQHVATQLGSTAAEQNAPITMGANQPAKAPLAVSDQAPTPIQSAQDVLGQAGQAVGGAASALGTAAQGALGTAQEINRIQPGTEAIKAVTPILGQAQQSAQTALGGAAGAVDQVASDLGQAAQGVVSGAAQTAGGAAQAATPVLGGAASAVGTTARGAADVLGATASDVGAGAQQAANDLGTAARGAADTTGQTLGGAAASVDQVRQQVQDTINSLPANATVAQARQTIGDTLDALGPRALDIAGDLPLPMGGTVSDLTNVGRGAQAGLQTIEEQRQAEIDRPDPFKQFQNNVDAARRGDWGAFATGTLALAQRPFEPVMGGSSADLAPSVSSALTAGGIDPNAARVIGQVANLVGPMALERAIPEIVSAASRGADAAVTAGLEAIDRLAPPEIASATTRRAGESADDYLARLSDEAAVQRPSAYDLPRAAPEPSAGPPRSLQDIQADIANAQRQYGYQSSTASGDASRAGRMAGPVARQNAAAAARETMQRLGNLQDELTAAKRGLPYTPPAGAAESAVTGAPTAGAGLVGPRGEPLGTTPPVPEPAAFRAPETSTAPAAPEAVPGEATTAPPTATTAGVSRAVTTVGGAVAGGFAGNATTPEDASPQERATRILLGAGAGAGLASGAAGFRGALPQQVLENLRNAGVVGGGQQSFVPLAKPARGIIAQGVDATKQLMLSNPATHTAYVIGNLLELLRSPAALAMGGRGDDALAGVVGGVRAIPAAADAARAAVSGQSLPTLAHGAALTGGPVYRVLGGVHAFTRTLGEYQGMAQKANQLLRDAGMSANDPGAATYLASQSNQIYDAGLRSGAQSVFMRPNTTAQGGGWLDNMFRTFTNAKEGMLASPDLKTQAGGALLDFGIPFSGIPTQMLNIAANRLPVAAQVSGAMRAVRALRAGDMAGAQEQIGRTGLESAIQLLIAKNIADGNITGADDPDHPDSVRIGGNWVDMKDMGAWALPMRIMASWADGYAKGGQNIPAGTPGQSMPEQIVNAYGPRFAGALNASMKPLAQGVPGENLFSALASLQQGGASQAGLKLAQNAWSRLTVPGAARFAENLSDPVARDIDKKGVDSLWQGTEANWPGLSSFLPAKIDPTTGQPVPKASSGLGIFLGAKNDVASPLTIEADRLNRKMGFTAVTAPKTYPTDVTIQGAKVSLSPDEQRAVTQLTGTTLDKMGQRLNEPAYQNASDPQKALMLKAWINAADNSRTAAVVKVLGPEETRARIIAGRNIAGQLVDQAQAPTPDEFFSGFNSSSGENILDQRRQRLAGAAA